MATDWNNEISHIVDNQNRIHDSDLPFSMQRAINSTLPSARKLERLVRANHNLILGEVMTLLNKGYHGVPMSFIDSNQNQLFLTQEKWTNIWLKLHSEVFHTILQQLPTLHTILNTMGDELLLFQVSVFYPPVDLTPHNGINKGAYRYLYPLQIPHDVCYFNPFTGESTGVNGSVGMKVHEKSFHWSSREGVIFDDGTHQRSHFAYE